ncbi:tetratricopeptide repeat protein [Pelosinus sp. sgz500959]|uniref:tetratricopeptide repeat protein n=1 Tax=Pelosinus sp. sgz500959 TaxID=3242472 RepID=UPI00366D7198
MNVMMYLNKGIELAIKGELEEAGELFRQAIDFDPNCSEAYNNLGLVFKDTNRLEEAEGYFRKALAINPNCPEVYNNLGIVQTEADHLYEALDSFHCAIELNPEYPEAYNNLGIAQSKMNLWDEAAYSFTRAIQSNPNHSETHFHLGIAQLRRNDLDEAINAFCQAIELNPYYAEAYFNMGVIQAELKMMDESVGMFYQAIELNPHFYEAYNNVGAVLRIMYQLEAAEFCLRRAIELRPDYSKAYNNLGLVLKDRYCLAEAEVCLRHSIELDPNDPETYNNLALVLKDVDRLEEAERCLCRAIELRPGFKEAEFALAFLYLLQEQYNKGWGKYNEWREFYEPKLKKIGYPHLDCPRWQGEDLTGRKILLFSDQGFGDAIQFVRYGKMIAELGAKTSIWVQKPLERLIKTSINSCEIYNDDDTSSGQFDFSCSLSRMPYMFNTDRETIPQVIPYIQTSCECATIWQERLNQLDGGHKYRVGVVWAGNPNHENDRNRSIVFDVFKELFDINEVSWISLQVGKRAEDLLQTPYPVLDISEHLSDFFETAGAINNLDLVITIDSAVAHLAGAMGKETWLLVPYNPDWRWQLKREDSPWYSTMKLFRQHEPGNWQEVLTRVKDALKKVHL